MSYNFITSLKVAHIWFAKNITETSPYLLGNFHKTYYITVLRTYFYLLRKKVKYHEIIVKIKTD